MIVLLPVLLGVQGADPLVLLKGMLRGRETYQAEVARDGARGTLLVRADGALIARSGSERIVHGPAGDGEFDSEENTYDVGPRRGPVLAGPIGTGRLAQQARALLLPPLVIRKGFADLPFKRLGKTLRYEANTGQVVHTITFDASRQFSRYEIRTPLDVYVWEVRHFGRVATPPDSAFAPTIPRGWSEYLEPMLNNPIQTGQTLPKSYANRAPAGKGPWLLAVLDGGPASKGASGWLDRWTAVPSARIENPSDADLRALGAERVPMFVLAGRDGKVLGVWLGYAKAMEGDLQKEIVDAARG